MSKGILNAVKYFTERRWMSRVLQSLEDSTTFSSRQVEFTWSIFDDVAGQDARDLLPIRLNSD